MIRTNRRTGRRPKAAPAVEALEGRALLSVAVLGVRPAAAIVANQDDGSGRDAILSALRGGPGSEFVTLIRRQVPNFRRVIAEFASGARTEISVRGAAAKVPQFRPGYTGPRIDQLNPTVAGAVQLNRRRLELGAIVRGPIDLPTSSTYVWGINRGGAAPIGPFEGLPDIRFDAVVAVTRDATGITGSVRDLNTGTVTPLQPSDIRIQGPTIRVLLNPALLPSTGPPLRSFRFAFWTQSGPGGLETIGGFVPSTASIPIGSLGRS